MNTNNTAEFLKQIIEDKNFGNKKLKGEKKKKKKKKIISR